MKTNDFYDRFSSLYPLVNIFLEPQKRFLMEQLNALASGHVLEIGVGNGSHLRSYRKHRVTAIDTSSAMLKKARQVRPPNVLLLLMNGESLKFPDNNFHYVVLSHVIAVVENPDALMAEVLRVLKPNGKVFILNHFTPNNWIRSIDHLFGPLSKVFHFRSVFHIEEVATIRQFSLLKEIAFRPFSYFKLLIYLKK